jgi:hypothetical protein
MHVSSSISYRGAQAYRRPKAPGCGLPINDKGMTAQRHRWFRGSEE